MPAVVRLFAVVACGLVAATGVGCSSSVGQTFGFTAPQHRLLADAKAFKCAAGTPDLPRELNKSLHPPFVVEPGDVLLVQPVEFDSPVRLTGDQPVLPDGTIDLGKYGRPVVAWKTVPVVEAEVQQLIRSQEKEPVQITARLINRASKIYYVLGEVNAPGAFPINGRETALDAIVAAGGLTRRATEKNIILSRPTQPEGCRVVLPICYPQIVQLGDTTTNYQLQNGDRIFVPSRTFVEDLFPTHLDTKCPPCLKPQFPCYPGGCDGPAGCAPTATPHPPTTPAAPDVPLSAISK
jgi:protein involved in polysaccharide export with SLBB domain